MRGKDEFDMDEVDNVRITPAYAGKSIFEIISMFGSRDHPRLCGEKGSLALPVQMLLGSPPPMRGKAQARPFPHRQEGITPAYAGKSRQNGKN